MLRRANIFASIGKTKQRSPAFIPNLSLPEEQTYLDVYEPFSKSDLPVAKFTILMANAGIIIHEDFGDKILRDVLRNIGIQN